MSIDPVPHTTLGMKSGIAFVVSHLIVDGTLPVQIIPRHVFRAARDPEIEAIRGYIAQSSQYVWINYEGSVRREWQSASQALIHIDPLPRDQWKYWVIAVEGSNHNLFDVELMGLLLPVNFELGFTIFYDGPDQTGTARGWQLMPLHIIERYSAPGQAHGDPETLTTAQITLLGDWLDLYMAIPDQYAFVKTAIMNFSDLRRVPAASELTVVGLFSIIESLITHAPRSNETLDSITHQISNKAILLRKKFSRVVMPVDYFLKADEAKIWQKLYHYRSAVAHGTAVQFEGEFQVLKERSSVVRFLSDNVKELILLSLKEPEFMFDLRQC